MSQTNNDSFKQWIVEYIKSRLNHKGAAPLFIVWCDPKRIWKELLTDAARSGGFEVWADDYHELILRQKFFFEEQHPRVIWLPVSKDEIGYFKVYALHADYIIQISLPEALGEFGVELPFDQVATLEPILPAHALQWIDYPLSFWKEKFSLGEVKLSLVDDETILSILASPGKALSELITPDRLPILNRRVMDDFGLPPLYEGKAPPQFSSIDIKSWRIRCTAALLVTEADAALPANPPGDRDRVIHDLAARDRALKLLSLWQKQFDLVDAFQDLAGKADAITTLQYWAKNLPEIPAPLLSPVVETIRFQLEIEAVARLNSFEELADYLSRHVDTYRNHANNFWGKRAKNQVKWSLLVDLAESSVMISQHTAVEKHWQTCQDAASWYVESGWRVDWVGEQLFKETIQIPGALVGVRAKLRQAYLRHLDRINTAFADLVSYQLQNGTEHLPLDYAGDILTKSIQPNPKQPIAVIMVDACRYDVGCRLVEAINRTEPVQRAEVMPARSTIPTITPLGMTFALPGISDKIKVDLVDNPAQPWLISTEHFAGNLADASQRREWLKQNFKVKEQAFLSIDQVLNCDSPDLISTKALGRLVFVFGDELDDHEGVLKPYGLDGVIDRYASLIRRLQTAGYSTIYLVTDHGFYQWEPASDEKDVAKPEGEILWRSRRAMAGRQLKHSTANILKIKGSDLDCCIPRSINSFKTYGGLGFFHGGLTLQEWIIPVITVRFPQKAQKIGGVLKPVSQITSLAQRIKVGSQATQLDLLSGQAHENYLSRPVMIKVIHPSTGKVVFKTKQQMALEPGGEDVTLELVVVPGATASLKSELDLLLLDADDEEVLDRSKVTLQVELDDWE
jgi:hypothetical protein